MHPRLLDLMQRCWEAAPTKRPTFSDIRVELEELLKVIQLRKEKTTKRRSWRFPVRSKHLVMVEEKQHPGGGRRGEKRTDRLGRPSPNPPRLSPCKRNPATSSSCCSSSSSSSSFHHLLKKTRFAPDLFLCHSCGLRFPSKSNNNNPLDHLRSQWRVALLCRTCLARVKSADICSYCFSPFSSIADAERSLTCLSCSCRVHVGCVDREHRCLDPCRLEPGSFTCVDCCVIPKFWGRKPGIGSRVSLEVVVREASSVAEKKIQAAARAREIALKKADATNRAAERARNALGAVLAPKGEIPEQNVDLAVVTDQELALQLHLAMNGSRRISRSSSCSLSSGAVGSIDTKNVCDRGGDQMSRTVDSGDQGICKAAEICAEDNSFFDVAARTVFGQGSDVDSESNRKLIDDTGKDGPTVMPLEDQGNSSDKIVSSDADFCSTDSVSLDYEKKKVSDGVLFPSTCRRYVIEGSEVQENNSITTPDRYLVKYTARRSRPKGLVNVDYPLLP
ncbi:hypothetical protein GW17_00025792 [Ensete ventricosum]|nr:hypothetical protein GW17_00025792 [Ensete ventricosum]RZS00575.1 hypothetical protein BHM03_00030304 [Ensete ventricosum]